MTVTDNFPVFARAIRHKFDNMAQNTLYVVDCDTDALWEHYLNSFPEGTNPVFRERRHYDCSCCRYFIRTMGNVVSMENGVLTSIWNIINLPEPFQTVALAMHEFIIKHKIRDVFYTKQNSYGTEFNYELINDKSVRWDHFSLRIPSKFISPISEEIKGDLRTSYAVLKRGIEEFSEDAIITVLDLIKNNNIYRGEQYKTSVQEFLKIKKKIETHINPDLIMWRYVNTLAARFKNSVIGSLIEDLSKGMDLELAVKAFELKVAPENYKRSSSLITLIMIKNAMKALEDLNLKSAIERRHAKLSDISVNSVLYVDRDVKAKMRDGFESLLLEEVKPKPFDKNRVEQISINNFIHNVIPKTTIMSVFVSNDHIKNMMSLTAPIHDDVENLFHWNNNIAWSYEGGTDSSIKERVKRAGGQVENVNLRVSLSWNNTDDLDLAVTEPSRNRIYYGNKCNKLDIDMNVGGNLSRTPVENIRWINDLADGEYKVEVHQFRKRESTDVGFEIELEKDGELHNFSYHKAVPENKKIHICTITVKKNKVVNIEVKDKDIIAQSSSRDHWGIKTNTLVKVQSVILSPNYWDEENSHGNKHWFFILEGCLNPQPVRGFYNEYLKPELHKHRKVFEVLADKTKCAVSPDQLSGVGFSSTIKTSIIAQVTGPGLNKIYNINFGKTD